MGRTYDVRDYVNELLRLNPWMEHTLCPHCQKSGKAQAMTYLKDMSFRDLALFECPRCGTTLDKPIHRAIPTRLGIKPKGPVFHFRL